MEKPTHKATVVVLVNGGGEVCLASKKIPIHHSEGEIPYSLDTLNGYGGKEEEIDETIFDTAVRELKDESTVVVKKEDLELVSRVYFYTKKENAEAIPYMDVSFFLARKWTGEPKETDEMGPPTFFAPINIPFDKMMPADEEIFNDFLRGGRNVLEVILLGKKVAPEIKVLDEVLEC